MSIAMSTDLRPSSSEFSVFCVICIFWPVALIQMPWRMQRFLTNHS
jgi:hypothetical protein